MSNFKGDRKVPGGLTGTEILDILDKQQRVWKTSLQEIADLATGLADITDAPAVELNTDLVLKPDGAGGVTWGVDASATEITSIPTTETNTDYVLQPDGLGGVVFATGSTTLSDGIGTTANGSAVDLGGTQTDNIEILDTEDWEFKIETSTASVLRSFYMKDNNFIVMRAQEVSAGGDYAYQSLGGGNVTIQSGGSGWGGEVLIDGGETYLYSYDPSNHNYIRVKPTGIFADIVKSGATTAAAGADVNEFWVTASHATLPDGVVMYG